MREIPSKKIQINLMSRPGRCIRPRIREILETSSVPRIFKNIRGIPYRIEIHFLFHSEDPSNSRGRLFLIVYFSQSVALLPSLSPLFPFFFFLSRFFISYVSRSFHSAASVSARTVLED